MAPNKLIFIAFCGLLAVLLKGKNEQDYNKITEMAASASGIDAKSPPLGDAIQVGNKLDPHIAAACKLEAPKIASVENPKPKGLRN